MKVTRRFVTFAAMLALAAPSLLQASRLSAQSNEEAAVLHAVEALTKAMLDADRGRLEELVADQLSYGHSNGRIQTKAICQRDHQQADDLQIHCPERAVDRDRRQQRNRAAHGRRRLRGRGKAGSAKIGVLQVWVKQDGRWKLLAR